MTDVWVTPKNQKIGIIPNLSGKKWQVVEIAVNDAGEETIKPYKAIKQHEDRDYLERALEQYAEKHKWTKHGKEPQKEEPKQVPKKSVYQVFAFMTGERAGIALGEDGKVFQEWNDTDRGHVYDEWTRMGIKPENTPANRVQKIWSDNPSDNPHINDALLLIDPFGDKETTESTTDPVAEWACVGCGCTDSNPCVTEDGACTWVEQGWCSECDAKVKAGKMEDPRNQNNQGHEKALSVIEGELEEMAENVVKTLKEDQTPAPSNGKKTLRDGQYDLVEVPAETTKSEERLRAVVIELKNLELERNSVMADFNRQIKDLKTSLFDLVNGRPMKHVRSIVRFRWDRGVKEWCSVDNESVVLQSVPITEEERTQQMDLFEAQEAAQEAPESTRDAGAPEPPLEQDTAEGAKESVEETENQDEVEVTQE